MHTAPWSIHTEIPVDAGIRHLVYGLNPLITVLRENKIELKPLFKQSGISISMLKKPESQLAPEKELAFWTLAEEALGGGPIGLQLGQRYHCSSYGVLGLATLTSENLRKALETIFENIMMTWTFFALTASAGRGEGRLAFERKRDLGPVFRFMSDRGIAASYTLFSEALGQRLPLRRVQFMYQRPRNTTVYEDLFQCPVTFGRNKNMMCFDEEWMYHPLPQADAHMNRVYTAQCREVSRLLAANVRFSEIVRYSLLHNLARYSYLENVASRLSLSARTVQRKLLMENTSFTELVEDVRKNLSLEYLRETCLSVREISMRLGYGDTASFSHAFTRWFGNSPTEFRTQLRLAREARAEATLGKKLTQASNAGRRAGKTAQKQGRPG